MWNLNALTVSVCVALDFWFEKQRVKPLKGTRAAAEAMTWTETRVPIR